MTYLNMFLYKNKTDDIVFTHVRGAELSAFSLFEQKQTVDSVFTHVRGAELSAFSLFEQKQTVNR